MTLPIEQILRDVAHVEEHNVDEEYLRSHDPDVAEVCCHVKALAAEVERLRKQLDAETDSA